MKNLGIALMAVSLAACATVPDSGEVVGHVSANPSASTGEQWVGVESLRPTAYFTDGEEALHLGLLVEGGEVVGYRRVDEADADVSLTVMQRGDGRTMVDLTSQVDLLLKLDLYISPDNGRYMYASTCPIIANGSAFEMWPYDIAWFAVSNLRSLGPDDGFVCR